MSLELNNKRSAKVRHSEDSEGAVKKPKSRRGKIFKRRKDSFQEIAKKRIADLFVQSEQIFDEDEKLAKRYIFLANSISRKYKVPFTKAQKIKGCKVCMAFLKQGVNARIRLSKGNIVVKCFSCNAIRRFKHK